MWLMCQEVMPSNMWGDLPTDKGMWGGPPHRQGVRGEDLPTDKGLWGGPPHHQKGSKGCVGRTSPHKGSWGGTPRIQTLFVLIGLKAWGNQICERTPCVHTFKHASTKVASNRV